MEEREDRVLEVELIPTRKTEFSKDLVEFFDAVLTGLFTLFETGGVEGDVGLLREDLEELQEGEGIVLGQRQGLQRKVLEETRE